MAKRLKRPTTPTGRHAASHQRTRKQKESKGKIMDKWDVGQRSGGQVRRRNEEMHKKNENGATEKGNTAKY